MAPSVPVDSRSDGEQPFWSIDVRLLGRLLVFETAGQRAHETDCSLRSTTLIPKSSNVHDQTTLSAGFNLVGSTGISGHRSVPKDAPMSAPLPSDRSRHSNAATNDFFANMAPEMSDLEGLLDDPILGNSSGVAKRANMFLPANEYGRSIGDWFGVDLV